MKQHFLALAIVVLGLAYAALYVSISDQSVKSIGVVNGPDQKAEVFVIKAGSFKCFIVMLEAASVDGPDHSHKQPPQTAYLCPQN